MVALYLSLRSRRHKSGTGPSDKESAWPEQECARLERKLRLQVALVSRRLPEKSVLTKTPARERLGYLTIQECKTKMAEFGMRFPKPRLMVPVGEFVAFMRAGTMANSDLKFL